MMGTRTVWLLPVGLLSVAMMLGGAATQQVKSRQTLEWCRSGVCYRLYTFNDSSGDTWTAANEQCDVHGLHLTAVWDQGRQDDLNAAPPLAGTVTAWLAGRRSDNDTFVWLNGEEEKDVSGALSAIYTCGAVYLKIRVARHCHGIRSCLCERDKDPDCSFDEVLHENKCIWSSIPAATWYNCRNRCKATGGDLASLSDNVAKVIDELTERTGVNYFKMRLWVGLHKRPWHWVSGTGQSSIVQTPMEYYHFGTTNGYLLDNKCIYVNMGVTDRLWIDAVCHTNLTSFICDDGPVPVISSPPTTSQRTTTARTPEEVNTSIRDVTTPEENEKEGPTNDKQFCLSVGGVAGVAVGFAALSAAFIALSVCLWKSRTNAMPSRVPEVTTQRPKEKQVKLSALETNASTTTIVEDELYEDPERAQPQVSPDPGNQYQGLHRKP